jgi:heterodisulfide reductase subunit A
LGREVSIKADILVLSTGMVPQGSGELARALGLERNGDGFFVEADPKWRPVECTRDGFFLCGTAHSPRSIKETIAQAQAAAQKALTVLTREVIVSPRIIAEVKSSLCTLCQLCVAACPYGARWVDEEEERIVVDPLACRGCGSCATACPSGAAFVRGLEEKGLMKEIQVSLEPLQDGVGSA